MNPANTNQRKSRRQVKNARKSTPKPTGSKITLKEWIEKEGARGKTEEQAIATIDSWITQGLLVEIGQEVLTEGPNWNSIYPNIMFAKIARRAGSSKTVSLAAGPSKGNTPRGHGIFKPLEDRITLDRRSHLVQAEDYAARECSGTIARNAWVHFQQSLGRIQGPKKEEIKNLLAKGIRN